ncbi:hypothetical protein WJX82_003741 [Trebouxia sp. C0006]
MDRKQRECDERLIKLEKTSKAYDRQFEEISRDHKSFNLVMYNIPEEGEKAKNRFEAIKTVAKEFDAAVEVAMSEYTVDEETMKTVLPTTIERIGQFTADRTKPRPVRLVFSTLLQKHVEVAARALVKDAPDKDPSKIDTQNVWPWSLLVPFIRQDLMRRAGDIHLSEAAEPAASPLDPYQNSLVMPLAEFIEHPLADELVHNGQTLQVLGLTNYSHWKEAAPIRQCLQGSQTTQKLLSSLALKQLQRFVHVGVMDMLDESIEALASTLKLRLDGPAWRNAANTSTQSEEAQRQADEQAFVEQPSSQLNRQQTEPDSAFLQPGPLWESYRQCALRARRKNAGRRTRSVALLKLPDGRQVEFGSEARAAIDPNILARIRQLNQMDVDLYEAGKQLLLDGRKALRTAGQLQHLPQLSQNASKIHQRRPLPETQGFQGSQNSTAHEEL